MNVTSVLAKSLGAVLLVCGATALNEKTVAAIFDGMENSKALLWLMGLVAFIIGAGTLAVHSVWSRDWTLTLTVIGWLALIKGASIMLFPNAILSFYKRVKTGPILTLSGVVVIILGLFLLSEGIQRIDFHTETITVTVPASRSP